LHSEPYWKRFQANTGQATERVVIVELRVAFGKVPGSMERVDHPDEGRNREARPDAEFFSCCPVSSSRYPGARIAWELFRSHRHDIPDHGAVSRLGAEAPSDALSSGYSTVWIPDLYSRRVIQLPCLIWRCRHWDAGGSAMDVDDASGGRWSE
jgi:hypothetical protein